MRPLSKFSSQMSLNLILHFNPVTLNKYTYVKDLFVRIFFALFHLATYSFEFLKIILPIKGLNFF